MEDEKEKGGGGGKKARKRKLKKERERGNASKNQSFPTCDPISRSCIPSRLRAAPCERRLRSGPGSGGRGMRAAPLSYLSLPYLPRGGREEGGWGGGKTDYLVP